MVKDYPENGKTYYAILDRLYFDNFSYGNVEIMDILDIPRSSYYRYLNKAHVCFYNHFIGVLKYENIQFNENILTDDFEDFH